MKAILLAAGRGSRLGDLTAERPKCLTPLFGRPLIEWQLAALKAGGVTEVGIVTGYRSELLERYGDRRFRNDRWASTNMVRSLACATEWLEQDRCLVSYSDIFYPATLVSTLAASTVDLAVAYDPNWKSLWQARSTDPLADTETFRLDAAGRITEIGNRPTTLDEVQGQYMGLLLFSPRSWQAVEAVLSNLDSPSADRLDMTSLLRRLIALTGPISAQALDGVWGEVDTPDDLALYESKYRPEDLGIPPPPREDRSW